MVWGCTDQCTSDEPATHYRKLLMGSKGETWLDRPGICPRASGYRILSWAVYGRTERLAGSSWILGAPCRRRRLRQEFGRRHQVSAPLVSGKRPWAHFGKAWTRLRTEPPLRVARAITRPVRPRTLPDAIGLSLQAQLNHGAAVPT